jgi:U3 small nucleolar RNA-associated protein 25
MKRPAKDLEIKAKKSRAEGELKNQPFESEELFNEIFYPSTLKSNQSSGYKQSRVHRKLIYNFKLGQERKFEVRNVFSSYLDFFVNIEDSTMMENYQEIKEIVNSLGNGTYQDFANGAQGMVSDNGNNLAAPSPRELAIEHIFSHIELARALAVKKQRINGFTRPRVLILLPSRGLCAEYIMYLSKLKQLENSTQLENYMDSNDDNFILGLKVKANTIRLFCGFYVSDVIIASPLALYNSSLEDSDYLSSIEITLIDGVRELVMQNMQHLKSIMSKINLKVKKDHQVDITTLREYYFDDSQRFRRQTIVLAGRKIPEIIALQKYCYNDSGSISVSQAYPNLVTRPCFFHFVEANSLVADFSAKKELLTKRLWEPKTVIVIPSYYDLILLKTELKNPSLDFACLTEYSKRSLVDTTRHAFSKGLISVVILTERLLFYRSIKFEGINQLIFFGIPYFEDTWIKLAGEVSEQGKIHAIYSKFNGMALERITGSDWTRKMVKGEKKSFLISK